MGNLSSYVTILRAFTKAQMKAERKLLIDTRERNVLRHQTELAGVNYEVMQITTADYAIVDANDQIEVAIERKSLEDYAASLKDGRCDNINKLLKLRWATGCRLFYIIEGPAYPRPEATFGRIPFSAIESSIFHLMLRDNVNVIWTESTLGTAQLLARLMRSMGTMRADVYLEREVTTGGDCSESLPVKTNDKGFLETPAKTNDNDNNTPAKTNDNDNNTPAKTSTELLTQVHKKTDHEVRREMWSCFSGISTESADEFIAKWTIADIVCDRIPREQIMNAKTANGRKISKRVIASLTGIGKPLEVRLLSCVEGISAKTAAELTAERPLRALLGYGVDGISMIRVGKKQKCLGDVKAARVLRLFCEK